MMMQYSQDPIFLLKLFMGTRNNFRKLSKNLAHALTKVCHPWP